MATDTPSGCFGIGGAPGESVYIKAGVSEVEPLPIFEDSYLRMNIGIGNQSNGGGETEQWTVEWGNPRWMLEAGYDESVLKPGDLVIVTGQRGLVRVGAAVGPRSGYRARH